LIDFDIDPDRSLAVVRPTAPLDREDFVRLAKAVDPLIEATGGLSGVIVDAASFPGWDDFAALVSHFRFVRDHHKHVKKIAVVTDSPIGELAEKLVAHFVSADVKHFPANEAAAAEHWIVEG
jgi:hypothetical protein